jgi:hypothetical protein
LIELDQHLLGWFGLFYSRTTAYSPSNTGLRRRHQTILATWALFKDCYHSSELNVAGPGAILALPPSKTLLPKSEMNHNAVTPQALLQTKKKDGPNHTTSLLGM